MNIYEIGTAKLRKICTNIEFVIHALIFPSESAPLISARITLMRGKILPNLETRQISRFEFLFALDHFPQNAFECLVNRSVPISIIGQFSRHFFQPQRWTIYRLVNGSGGVTCKSLIKNHARCQKRRDIATLHSSGAINRSTTAVIPYIFIGD